MTVIMVSKSDKGKGETLFAAHLAVALSEKYKTALVDFRPSSKILQSFIEMRQTLNETKKLSLSVPTYFAYHKNIVEELKADYDYIILDTTDLRLAPLCDILITLISSKKGVQSFMGQGSSYANKLWKARKERATQHLRPIKSFVVPNGIKKANRLERSSMMMGYRVTPEILQNESYAEGLKSGITVFDKNMSYFAKLFHSKDFFARRNLRQIIEFILSFR